MPLHLMVSCLNNFNSPGAPSGHRSHIAWLRDEDRPRKSLLCGIST